MAIREHIEIVRGGTTAVEQWLAGSGGREHLDLSGEDLRGIDLGPKGGRRALLSRANLSDTVLAGASAGVSLDELPEQDRRAIEAAEELAERVDERWRGQKPRPGKDAEPPAAGRDQA